MVWSGRTVYRFQAIFTMAPFIHFLLLGALASASQMRRQNDDDDDDNDDDDDIRCGSLCGMFF